MKIIFHLLSIFTTLLRTFFLTLFLPFFLPIWFLTAKKWTERGKRKLFSFALQFFICLLILFPIYGISYGSMMYIGAYILGYIPQSIQLSGTGSMYPTFPKGHGKDPKLLSKEIVSTPLMYPYPGGIEFRGKRYFQHIVDRGDIVIAENQNIREMSKKLYGQASGVAKRIIAIPGDTIELKDGIVYVNSTPQKEPYTAKPRSTFGGKYLSDCKKITLPKNKYFLMGDNRKASSDSRHDTGLVDERDIQYVIPLIKQKGTYDKNWRNTNNDFADSAKIDLDEKLILELINQYRKQASISALIYEPKLAVSAKKRGEKILQYNDFSYEATKSGYTITRSFRDAEYSNITWGEWLFQGYYDSEELIESMFEFSESKKFALDGDFDDFGIAQIDGLVNNCPTRVIVEHFAGYIPPNYSASDIESWKRVLSNLREISPGWNNLKNNKQFYDQNRRDLDRINEIISLRSGQIEMIISKMEANVWLTQQERSYIMQDETLYKEQESLATLLNAK